MEINIHNLDGSKEKMAVSDSVFHTKMNKDLVYQVATSLMSNMRKVIAHTKTRSEVAGGGKKPWRQKGTGRARHGSIRSPIWIGGGVAHGPTKDVNFKKKINKSQARAALSVVLSARVADGSFAVVEKIAVASGKTKDGVRALTDLTKNFVDYKHGNSMLVVLSGVEADKMTRRALANLSDVTTIRAQDLNTLTVLSHKYVLCSKDALQVIDKTFAKKSKIK